MEEQKKSNTRGLGPREKEVIAKLTSEPNECVRLYTHDGKIAIFSDEARAYQAWGWKVIKRLLKRGLVLIKMEINPQTKRPIKYLCLKH